VTYEILAKPCFEVVTENTGDGNAHASTQEKLDGLLAALAGDVVVTVTMLTDVCAADITCDGCGYVLDEDDDGRVHVPHSAFTTVLAAYGWHDLGERVLCPECAREAGLVEVPTEGQVPLPGMWEGPV
jgi:rubredoxin